MICEHCHQKVDGQKTRYYMGKTFHSVCFDQVFPDAKYNCACAWCGLPIVDDDVMKWIGKEYHTPCGHTAKDHYGS